MKFTPTNLAEMLGVSSDSLMEKLGEIGDWPDLDFRFLSETEEQDCIKATKALLNEGKLRVCGQESQSVWENGWGEVLDNVEQNGLKSENLEPQYFHHTVLRYDGQYIETNSERFESRLYTLIKRYIFNSYFKDIGNAVEFGCGTGTSLLLLSEMYPELAITGCDWSMPAVRLAEKISKEQQRNIRGVQFNLFSLEGAEQVSITPESGIYTFHTLEQIGADFEPFIDWLLACRPKICIHLEPIKEFYDPSSPIDQIALQYHEQRNYLGEMYTHLKSLASDNRINILEARRLGFGSQYQEAYSLIVWAPI